MRNQQDIEVMKRCHVIGMTVTGATMRANLLGKVYLMHCSNLFNLLVAKNKVYCVFDYSLILQSLETRLETSYWFFWKKVGRLILSVNLHPLFSLFSLLCGETFHVSWQKNFPPWSFFKFTPESPYPFKPVTFHWSFSTNTVPLQLWTSCVRFVTRNQAW